MTLTYRGNGGWGTGKGVALTAAEFDGNTYHLAQAIAAILADPPSANSIANITLSGSQLTITLDDATPYTFTVPSPRWRWRDEWADATVYAVNDVFRDEDGNLYAVLVGHTSVAPFDPAREISSNPVYELILDASAFGGGGGGFADVITSSATEINPTLEQANYLWLLDFSDSGFETGANRIEVILPANSEVAFPVGTRLSFLQYGNQIHVYNSGLATTDRPVRTNAYSRQIGSIITATKIGTDDWFISGDLEPTGYVVTLTGTTHTLRHDQIGAYFRCTHASGCDITVPLNSAVAIPVGAEFHFRQCNTGDVTILEPSGVTVNAKAGSSQSTAELGSVITLKKVAANEWDLFGDDA